MREPTRQLFDAIGAQLVLAGLGGPAPRVGDEYEIEAIVGAGGFGLICRATQLALHRRVALKLYPLGGPLDSGVREALREARSLARLEHPGIVAVHDAGESELIVGAHHRCAFVEMQYVEGQTLVDWLASGERSADAVLRVLVEAGRALGYAHELGVVHRDFKPQNIMVDQLGRARVIDFGLALATEAVDPDLANWGSSADALGSRATGTGLVRGTPGYMAPEASQGLPRAASDQFSFAVVVREALTGEHPFLRGANGPPRVRPRGGLDVFASIKPSIDRAMAPTPGDRFATVAALCDALAVGPVPARTPRRWLGFVGASLASVATAVAIAMLGPCAEPTEASIGAPVSEGATAEPPPLSPTSGRRVGPCPELDPWAGTWQVGGRVGWTEYASQLDWWLAFEFELSIGDECRVDVVARGFRPLVEGQPRGEPVIGQATVLAIGELDGTWRVPLELTFANDSSTYANQERYDLELQLDRVEGRERLAGGFRRIDAAGNWIRTGVLLGARERIPEPTTIASTELPCRARCRVECAGAQAESECVEGCKLAPTTECGPPSLDFDLPLRIRTARQMLARGENLLDQSLTTGGTRTKLLGICSANARALTGPWSIGWTDGEARSGSFDVELVAEGCKLSGTAHADADSTALTGEVTVAGTWLIEPVEAKPWFGTPVVLVGVGAHAPAFGSDLGDPPRLLRARRR